MTSIQRTTLPRRRSPAPRLGAAARAAARFDRGRLLSRKALEGDAVTPSEARAKWDNWVAAQTIGYLTDDYEPDLSGAPSLRQASDRVLHR